MNLQKNYEFSEENIIDKHLSEIGHHNAQNLLRIILTVSTNFINLPYDQTDKGINDALKLIGDYSQVDRSYLFQVSQNGNEMSNTHEWCAQDIESQLYRLQHIPVNRFPWFYKRICRGDVVHVPDVSQLPDEAEAEKSAWQSQKIKSLIIVPVVSRGYALGFIGFDTLKGRMAWTNETISLLRFMGEIFANALERKSSLESLRESEARYKTLFENANDAIFLMKEDMFIDCNSRTLRMFGCSKDDIIGKPPYKFSPPFQPDGRGSKEKALEKIYAALFGYPQYFEWQHCRFDGTPLDTEVSLNRVELGGKLFVQAIVRDVSSRKMAEAALKRSEEKYRSIFENAVEGMFQITPDGRCLSANPSLAKMYGYNSPEEIITAITDLRNKYVNPEDRDRLKASIEEDGYVEGFETQMYRKDGTKIWISMTARAVRDESGKIVCYEGTSEDITERKEMEQLLQSEWETFYGILQNAPYGTVLVDRDGRYLFINQEFTAITGYTLEDVPTGREWYAKAFPDESYRRSAIEEWKKDLRVRGGNKTFHIICKDNTSKEVEFRTALLDDRRAFTMLVDITDRKRAEKALRESEDYLKTIFNYMQTGMVIIDAEDHAIIDVNPTASDMIGADIMSIIGSECHNYLCPADVNKCPITDLGKSIHNAEYYLKKADGQLMPVMKTVIPISIRGHKYLLESFIDITDRKRFEQALEENEKKYRSLFEGSRDAIYITSADGQLKEANQAFLDLFGYSREEIVHSNAKQVYASVEDKEIFKQAIQLAIL